MVSKGNGLVLMRAAVGFGVEKGKQSIVQLAILIDGDISRCEC